MFCSNCGNEIAEDSIFCSFCGGQTKVTRSDSKRCPLCGKEAAAKDSVYCDECGTMLEENDSSDMDDSSISAVKNNIVERADCGDPTAQNLLGYYYATGTGGMECDMDKARYYFEEAAAAGNANAQYNLANFYINALGGLEKNEYQAELWVKKAADNGHIEAQNAMKQYFAANNTLVEAFLPLIGAGLRAAKKASRKEYNWRLFP